MDKANIDTVIEQGQNLQQGDELKLEETCVMVTKDELQLVPKARVNPETSEVHNPSLLLSLVHVKLEVNFYFFLHA